VSEPRSLEAILDRIETHADSIFVREKLGGKWGYYALSDLPAKLALAHAIRFIREGAIPRRPVTALPGEGGKET
jgi:hypothetical protein